MFYLFGLAVVCSVAYFFWMPVAEGSPFHTSFHFVCHFSIMMMGAMVYVCRDRISMGHWVKDVCGMALSFVLYFLILAIGKNKTGWMYDVQVLALVPLHSFVYYGYKWLRINGLTGASARGSWAKVSLLLLDLRLRFISCSLCLLRISGIVCSH